jgi:uncharacterized protein YegJ (DUF2314 family)
MRFPGSWASVAEGRVGASDAAVAGTIGLEARECLMMNGRLRVIAVVTVLCAGPAAAVLAQEVAPVVNFQKGDPEMVAAQSKARATLSQFWQAHENPRPNEHGFSLKLAVPISRGDFEHIWMSDIERQDGKITGIVNNIPRDATWLRTGQRIVIAEDRISDWMFRRGGKIVGNQTLRPALNRMPAQEAAHYRAMLEEP